MGDLHVKEDQRVKKGRLFRYKLSLKKDKVNEYKTREIR